jgi:hypothetical protein
MGRYLLLELWGGSNSVASTGCPEGSTYFSPLRDLPKEEGSRALFTAGTLGGSNSFASTGCS